MVRRELVSYDGGVTASPEQFVLATGAEQLAQVVRNESAYPSPVRAMGSFHSLTPCAASTGTMVDMTRLAEVLTIDAQRMTMTAQAGVQILKAARILRAQGLQLPLNIEIGNATLGSAACCHSKDALDGVRGGQLNSFATAMKWIDAAGEVRHASEETDPELFHYLRCSHGLCGIITEVTFRIQPLQTIWLNYRVTDLDRISQPFVDDILGQNEGVIVWTLGKTVVFQTRNRHRFGDHALEVAAGFRRGMWSFWGAYVGQRIGRLPPGPRRAVLAAWFDIATLGYRAFAWLGGYALGNPSKIIDYSRTPPSARYAFTFWAFPRQEWIDHLRAYYEFAEAHSRRTGFRCLLPLGSYFVRADRGSLLSHSYDHDTISIDPIHAVSDGDRPAWERFLHEFNDWAYERGGVPLLNQSPFVERHHLERAYGARWTAFSAWAKRCDPRGRFRNAFFEGLLL